jgi:large subunit ribosomal protein L21
MKKNTNTKKNSSVEQKESNENKGIVSLDRYAIIKTGGKQYFAVEGQALAIEKLNAVEGEEVVFNEVLLRRTDKDTCLIGQPFLETPVKAKVIKHIRGKKVVVFKFKRRKKYRTKQGHRQSYTVVRFTSVV